MKLHELEMISADLHRLVVSVEQVKATMRLTLDRVYVNVKRNARGEAVDNRPVCEP